MVKRVNVDGVLYEAVDGTILYGCRFSLTAPVLDLKAAQNYLDEDHDLMLGVFNEDTSQEDWRERLITDWRWYLTSPDDGVFVYETSRPLTRDELHRLEESTEGQASDGLGEGFCQQEWSDYEDPDYDPRWDEDEPEEFLAEIDWYKGFKFKELNDSFKRYLR